MEKIIEKKLNYMTQYDEMGASDKSIIDRLKKYDSEDFEMLLSSVPAVNDSFNKPLYELLMFNDISDEGIRTLAVAWSSIEDGNIDCALSHLGIDLFELSSIFDINLGYYEDFEQMIDESLRMFGLESSYINCIDSLRSFYPNDMLVLDVYMRKFELVEDILEFITDSGFNLYNHLKELLV